MTRYINKADVVAEIERRKQVAYGWMETAPNDAIEAEFELCDDILSFLDTLEVKEVNLEKEFDNYTKNILACDVQFEPFTHLYNCAKHFYELGLKVAQKGE